MKAKRRRRAGNFAGPLAFVGAVHPPSVHAMTRHTAARFILALGLVLATLSARADCRDDLAILNARLASADKKAPNVGAAKKEALKAEEEQKNEVACSNSVARAWRAFRKPPPDDENEKQ